MSKREKPEAWFDAPTDKRTSRDDGEEQLPPLKMSKSIWGGDLIEVPMLEAVKNKYPLSDGPILGTITGQSGTGKSRMLLSLIPCVGKLTQLIVCTKVVGNPVNLAVKAYCKAKKIEYGFGTDPQSAMDTIEKFIAKKKQDTYCLVVFDDFNNGNNTSRTDPYMYVMNTTSSLLRNYGVHSISITQMYTGHSNILRNNCRFMINFKMLAGPSTKAVAKDWATMTNYPPEAYLEIYRKVTKSQHGYLFSTDQHIHMYSPNVFGEVFKEIEIDLPDSDEDSEDEDSEDDPPPPYSK